MDTQLQNRCALALDNISEKTGIKELISLTLPWIGIYKIGLEQFIRFGPPVLDLVHDAGRKIFLDLKLHDIPNTVAQAVRSVCDLGVDYLTIHAQGGHEMMSAAVHARDEHRAERKPAIIAVTLLTSISEQILNSELLVRTDVASFVQHCAKQAVGANVDGIVCSAADLTSVRHIIPLSKHIITPGIRPAGSASNDQKRIATPADAIRAGATILVLGRAVSNAPDVAAAARDISEEIRSAI